ncbi:MAG: hypothetical protein JWM80_4920 [Cyanobacteria bacterium RYN_339]|nr:hypothetical protein [Cyanobacteria bacterium RYN_339]
MTPRKRDSQQQQDGDIEAAGLPDGYLDLLQRLKAEIRATQVRAALAANREVVLLYWRIGQEILHRQQADGWGSKVVDRLAADLRVAFPGMTGLSPRNLKYMRTFAAAYPDPEIVQRVVAQLPWRHNIALLDKLKSSQDRSWYAQKAMAHGWSRDVLAHHIDSGLLAPGGRPDQLRPDVASSPVRLGKAGSQGPLRLRLR